MSGTTVSQVMATIRDLCSEGHTVVVAIHQPRSSIYAMFDDVLLLSNGRVRTWVGVAFVASFFLLHGAVASSDAHT